jgi:hypothetical protein
VFVKRIDGAAIDEGTIVKMVDVVSLTLSSCDDQMMSNLRWSQSTATC